MVGVIASVVLLQQSKHGIYIHTHVHTYIHTYMHIHTVSSSPISAQEQEEYDDFTASSLSYQVADVELSEGDSEIISDGETNIATNAQQKREKSAHGHQQDAKNEDASERKSREGTDSGGRQTAAPLELELEKALRARERSAQFLARVLGE